MDSSDRALTDVRDMAIVHQFYRREFELAPRILRTLQQQQSDRRESLGWWLALVLLGMHHHHTAEDTHIFPVLQGRIAPDLIDRMAEQHEQVALATDAAEAALKLWRAAPEEGTAAVITAFEKLYPVLSRHLDEEEKEIVPLIERRMTPQEYGLMGTSGNRLYDERTLMMTFGGIVEQCSTEDAAYMISHLPDSIQDAWYLHGREDHRALMHVLREELEPIGFECQTIPTLE